RDQCRGGARLLDLGFLEFDVLTHDGIVLLEAQLLRTGPRVLLGDVEVAGASRREQLDFLRDWLRHDLQTSAHHARSFEIGRTIPWPPSVSSCIEASATLRRSRRKMPFLWW